MRVVRRPLERLHRRPDAREPLRARDARVRGRRRDARERAAQRRAGERARTRAPRRASWPRRPGPAPTPVRVAARTPRKRPRSPQRRRASEVKRRAHATVEIAASAAMTELGRWAERDMRRSKARAVPRPDADSARRSPGRAQAGSGKSPDPIGRFSLEPSGRAESAADSRPIARWPVACVASPRRSCCVTQDANVSRAGTSMLT